MILAKLKSLAVYAAILAAGLGVGVGVAKVPKLLEKPYMQGDYAAYFPDSKTRVVVYGTTTCPFCAKTRQYLNERKIAYADLNVDVSDKAQQEFKALKGSAVPVILIGDRLITGFKPAAIDDALQAVAR